MQYNFSLLSDNTVVSGPDEAEQAEQIAAARGYLRRDLIVFKNFNPYRSSDVMAVVLVTLYASLLLTDLHYSYFVYAAVLARAIHRYNSILFLLFLLLFVNELFVLLTCVFGFFLRIHFLVFIFAP